MRKKDSALPYYPEQMELRSRIARNMFYLRKQRGLTHREIALKMGLSRSLVNMLELGQRTPRLRTLVGLSDALGVSLEYFLAADISTYPQERLQKIYGVPLGWYSLSTRIKEGGVRWHDPMHSALEVEVEGISGYCNQVTFDAPASADFLASFADVEVVSPEALANRSVIAYYHLTSLRGLHRRKY